VGKAVPGIAQLFYQPSADFSDLDVRDAQNNKIQSLPAQSNLEALFRENLLNLMVFAPPHAAASTLSWLDSFSHLFNNLILARMLIVFSLFQDAILPPIRRFVHNVHNLCISFSVGIFAGCLCLSACSLLRSPQRINIRC
jgi:hypothetical protein